jgi:hypothetical protein
MACCTWVRFFRIDGREGQDPVAGNAVLAPVVQHIEFVQAGIDAVGQMHVQLDYG